MTVFSALRVVNEEIEACKKVKFNKWLEGLEEKGICSATEGVKKGTNSAPRVRYSTQKQYLS